MIIKNKISIIICTIGLFFSMAVTILIVDKLSYHKKTVRYSDEGIYEEDMRGYYFQNISGQFKAYDKSNEHNKPDPSALDIDKVGDKAHIKGVEIEVLPADDSDQQHKKSYEYVD